MTRGHPRAALCRPAWPRVGSILLLVHLLVHLAACSDDPDPWAGEAEPGGETTVINTTRNAFAQPARNMDFARRQRFVVGNSFFNSNWVITGSSTSSRDGLGPTFNARSCSACHLRDGRAPAPAPDEPFLGLLLRLGQPGAAGTLGPLDAYGDQLQPHGILGVPGEGTPRVSFVETSGNFVDGTPYSLRVPTYTIDEPNFGPLPPDTVISPRVAPAMIGLGLLAAIPEAEILAAADPDDDDGDGISGRANFVRDPSGAMRLGRFGWKAEQPDVLHQSAAAFLGDLGITSSLFPQQNCPPAQTECQAAFVSDELEVSDDRLDDVTFYSSTLAVPARRAPDDPAVVRGKAVFLAAGCDGCHTPRHHTAADDPLVEAADQTIFPYTDLLVHDMGPELADAAAPLSAREWRTPPLWGLGLVAAVNGHTNLLHDGRARDFLEAVLWHGGEATRARDAVLALSARERDDLVAFLADL